MKMLLTKTSTRTSKKYSSRSFGKVINLLLTDKGPGDYRTFVFFCINLLVNKKSDIFFGVYNFFGGLAFAIAPHLTTTKNIKIHTI